ncbi:MAG TPA: rRNA methyltransferase [Clostridiales bacterium]|nr:rRNA methyltransferase [Clostridiales bacterium]
MGVQRIYTPNAAYQKFEVLKTNRNKRYRYRQFFVEGVRNINEAVENGWTIDSFIYSFEKRLSDWAGNLLQQVPTQLNYELTTGLMAEISGKTDTSEICTIVRMRQLSLPDLPSGEIPLLVLFDRPANKGNLGTVIRSCDALGVDALVITGHAVDLYDPETVGASMGSLFKLPVLAEPDQAAVRDWIGDLRQRHAGFRVVGTSAHADRNIDDADLTQPCLLVIGNETEGMSNYYYSICDELVRIPMAENCVATSLNVACAATVILYEATRQRKNRQTGPDQ